MYINFVNLTQKIPYLNFTIISVGKTFIQLEILPNTTGIVY